MLKKAGAVAAIAAGLMMLGSPAFAAGHDADYDVHQWNSGPLISALNGNNVNVPVGVCGNNIGILGLVAPVGSPQITGSCAQAAILDGHDNNVGGNDNG
ncbi:hypothetical protein ABZ816_05350 [Actinosynnema sp. NPDC047251]|uniref:Putative secreted protein n=1 Tax=Saccharothrix espanaensis (strain ATCC 51144 / DSM 44229 / JCM 9112 / NBRC 15066 / NRRL 15764) TaxID=1179773 RepID=K0JRT9_SACES|nr:hypothetical protein [Saccharothrix espanaensis]CCH28122.1 putative secreted protein [Saccharothrix espanaensis DSM 44229]